MNFLFRKRIKIFPGVWLNLSKGGVNTSIGGKVLLVLALLIVAIVLVLVK
jgi:hypothetical protein